MGSSRTAKYQFNKVYKIKGCNFGAMVKSTQGTPGNEDVILEDIYTGKKIKRKQQYR